MITWTDTLSPDIHNERTKGHGCWKGLITKQYRVLYCSLLMFYKRRKISQRTWTETNVQVLWSLCLQLTPRFVHRSITSTSRDAQYHAWCLVFLPWIPAEMCYGRIGTSFTSFRYAAPQPAVPTGLSAELAVSIVHPDYTHDRRLHGIQTPHSKATPRP